MRTASSLLTVLLLLTGACADGETDSARVTGGSGGDPTFTGPLEAPALDAVIPMSKVLRVRWTSPTPCQDIDGERRTDALTFAPAFSVPGTDTDYVDEEANEDQTYSYRVRCMRGDAASDWSNTLSGNPFLE
jgi:hypothetical protein